MLLSIVVHGRNDGFMGNFLWRIQTALNKMGSNLAAVGRPSEAEIILVDFGSPPGSKLRDALDLNRDCASRLTSIYVDPDTARSVAPDSTYSSSHAVNTAFRHARGRHILTCDSDVYWLEDTMQGLWDGLTRGWLGGPQHDVQKCFYWSARRHIPKAFNMTCPSQETLDAYVRANWHNFALDKPDKHVFAGATCALLATKEMLFAARGLNENLMFWGSNDLDIHYRLSMRYSYGGDVDDYGLVFFHLEHYYNRNMSAENPRRANDYVHPQEFTVNPEWWGLREQPVSVTRAWQP